MDSKRHEIARFRFAECDTETDETDGFRHRLKSASVSEHFRRRQTGASVSVTFPSVGNEHVLFRVVSVMRKLPIRFRPFPAAIASEMTYLRILPISWITLPVSVVGHLDPEKKWYTADFCCRHADYIIEQHPPKFTSGNKFEG